jgi:hypothetical protein
VDLAKVRDSVAFHRALSELSGSDIDPSQVSEATLLHAMFAAGLAAVRDEVEPQGICGDGGGTQSRGGVAQGAGSTARTVVGDSGMTPPALIRGRVHAAELGDYGET